MTWMDRAGQLAHYALCALPIAVLVVGIVVRFARGDALSVFGLPDIPSPWLADRAFARSAKEVHEVLANALVILPEQTEYVAAGEPLDVWLLEELLG